MFTKISKIIVLLVVVALTLSIVSPALALGQKSNNCSLDPVCERDDHQPHVVVCTVARGGWWCHQNQAGVIVVWFLPNP